MVDLLHPIHKNIQARCAEDGLTRGRCKLFDPLVVVRVRREASVRIRNMARKAGGATGDSNFLVHFSVLRSRIQAISTTENFGPKLRNTPILK